MTEEFNLSNTIGFDKDWKEQHHLIDIEDVKEFIKQCESKSIMDSELGRVVTIEKVKQLAGDKLI